MMQQLGDVLKKASSFLQQKGVSESRLSAEWLLADILSMNRLDLYLNFDRPMVEIELAKYREYISRRAKHEPVSYILTSQPFFGMDLNVSKDVLIPRPETEELVSEVLKEIKQASPLCGLDLCTGSGAIACSLKKHAPQHDINASDISSEALDVAQGNARKFELDIKFFKSDLTHELPDNTYDFVVCNPPYIAKQAMKELEVSVALFEPSLALNGGDDGLEYYKRLQLELPRILKDTAKIFLEIGFDQKQQVVDLFSSCPYDAITCLKDSFGKDRMIIIDFKRNERG